MVDHWAVWRTKAYMEIHFFEGTRKAPFSEGYRYPLAHMLNESGGVPMTIPKIGTKLQEIFRGKRVLEIGCRDGGFLNFALKHGASAVAGNTDSKRVSGARRSVGGKGTIVEARAEEVGGNETLRSFSPDIILSMNMLDASRWKEATPPKEQILQSMFHLARPGTKVYFAPSVDKPTESEKLFSESDLHRPEVAELSHEVSTYLHPPTHTFSFRVTGRH